MEKPKTTPKDFFLWAGAIITLYWSIVAGVLLMFDYINYAFPNPLSYYPADPYQSGIPYEMASVIVLLPLALLLVRIIQHDIVRDPSRKEIWVRRWALIFTLFIAGIAMATDLITLLTTFLSGEELTTAFLLKVLIIFLVAAAVFMHFIADLKGYWDMFPARRRAVDIGVGVLAVLIIVSGFLIVGTPQQARLSRFDATRIQNLQEMQYAVANYWQAKQQLPASLTDLNFTATDPQTKASYEYERTSTFSFKLCATFSTESRPVIGTAANYTNSISGIKNSSNWEHGIGTMCFDRVLDPSYYPPLDSSMSPVKTLPNPY